MILRPQMPQPHWRRGGRRPRSGSLGLARGRRRRLGFGRSGGRRLRDGVPVPPGRLRRHGVLLGPVAPKRQMVSLKVRVIEPVGTGGLEDRQVLLAQLTIPRLPSGGRCHRWRGDLAGSATRAGPGRRGQFWPLLAPVLGCWQRLGNWGLDGQAWR
jgi:hypothetical protein